MMTSINLTGFILLSITFTLLGMGLALPIFIWLHGRIESNILKTMEEISKINVEEYDDEA